ncbi:alpha/beta hydrolase [Mucilaginibacter sabulilitoris]|uniref:Alpha/beta hydrolase n=1 Tax=Mucilaginibacter sabulilitoris TaxID=1173583 RepID=A0ABZ0TGE5_9SPHI|nr:alpha/beta hydrolase [Mucilaginibacter sabulilitoris]WPU91876.1 alpha/beta hydrolase [Mucilaginibacter sabulilitoris]
MKPIHAEKQYLSVEGITIAYQERNPDQLNTIFFIHGNSGSGRTWIRQLDDPLFDAFRMVAFDLPGHGESAVPHPSTVYYAVTGLARILAAAIKKLAANKPYILVGVSLGTNISCECLPELGAKGIVLISPCIIGEDYPVHEIFKPDADLRTVFTDDPDEALIRQTLEACLYKTSRDLIADMISDYKKVKGNFRSLLYQSVQDQRYQDEVKLLEQSGLRPLVIFGRTDPISNINYLDHWQENVWSKEIHKLNSASHFAHLDQNDSINQLLYHYVTDSLTDQ